MEYIKVSFIGDIMCEKPFLHAAQNGRHQYDFESAFSGLSNLFKQSDYVIGNLETVCAGEEKKYSHELYSFNTPDSFITALKKCGIDFVSTANNHCLDRGIEGMKRTLDVLDSNGIEHTGTYRIKEEADTPCIVDVNGLKLGFIAYTYGTNSNMNGVLLGEKDKYCVNLLQPQEHKKDISLFGKIKRFVPVETKTNIKKLLGMSYKNITVDNMPKKFDERYLDRLSVSIRRIKEKADYTICLLHCGGQFNREPGKYSKYIFDFLMKQGIDSIIGNHPHNVQKAKKMVNGIATYCLGNVSISPSSIYVPTENLPDYSIALHLYFSRENKKLSKITASVLKIEEGADHYLRVLPVWDLYRNSDNDKKQKLKYDTKRIKQVFMGVTSSTFDMQEEWEVLL